MRARMLLLAAVSWLVVAPSADAREPIVPAPLQVAAAYPFLYVVSEVHIVEGDTLFFTNLDPTLPHDLVSEDYRPGTSQRVFRTAHAVTPADGPIQVVGVENLQAGDSRPFLCSLHDEMRGNVTVHPRPAA